MAAKKQPGDTDPDGECFDPSKPLWDSRRENFVQLIFNGRPIGKAYIEAGYQEDIANARAVRRRDDVCARLLFLQTEAALETIRLKAEIRCRTDYTKEQALKEAEEARLLAMSEGKASAAVAAVATKARIAGLIDNAEPAGPANKPLRDMTIDELQRVRNEISALTNPVVDDAGTPSGAAPAGREHLN